MCSHFAINLLLGLQNLHCSPAEFLRQEKLTLWCSLAVHTLEHLKDGGEQKLTLWCSLAVHTLEHLKDEAEQKLTLWCSLAVHSLEHELIKQNHTLLSFLINAINLTVSSVILYQLSIKIPTKW